MPPPATPPAISPPRISSAAFSRAEWSFLAALAGLAALLAGLRPDRAIDFQVYWLNARHYFAGASMYGPASGTGWAGGVYRYPPLFLDLFRPLAALPLHWGALVWAEGKIAVGAALLLAFRRRWALPNLFAFWPALLLLAPYFIQELRYGNAQFYIVALAVAAFLLPPRRAGAAGVVLGLAAALKVWPLFFLPCLAACRRWRMALSGAAATAAWTLLPALWRGPAAQFALLRQWLGQERAIAAAAAQTVGFWYPGQSLHDVLARYLSVVDYSRLPDARYPQVAWLQLSPHALALVWWTCAAVLTFALLALLARYATTAPDDLTVAFLFCALLVLQPHVHRLILETLLWPALYFAAFRKRRLPGAAKRPASFLWWLAVAASVAEPLVPGSARQRWLQTYASDFWLVLLPLTLLAVTQLTAGRRPAPAARSANANFSASLR